MPDNMKQFLFQHVEKVLFGIAAAIGLYYVFVVVQPFDTTVETVERLSEVAPDLESPPSMPLEETEDGNKMAAQLARYSPNLLDGQLFFPDEGLRFAGTVRPTVNPYLAEKVIVEGPEKIREVEVVHLEDLQLTPGLGRIDVEMTFPLQTQLKKLRLNRLRQKMTLFKIELQRISRDGGEWVTLADTLSQEEMATQIARAGMEPDRPRRRPQDEPDGEERVRFRFGDDDERDGEGPRPGRDFNEPFDPGMDPVMDPFGGMGDPMGGMGMGPGMPEIEGKEIDIAWPRMEARDRQRKAFRFTYQDTSVEANKRYRYRAKVYVTNPYAEPGKTEIASTEWNEAPMSNYASPKSDKEFYFAGGVAGDPTMNTDPRAIVRVKVYFRNFKRIPKKAFDKIAEKGRIEWGDSDKYGFLGLLPNNWLELAELEQDADGYWYKHDFGKGGARLGVGDTVGSVLKDREFVELISGPEGRVFAKGRRLEEDAVPEVGRQMDEPEGEPIVENVPVDFDTGCLIVDVTEMVPEEAEDLKPKMTLLCMDTRGNMVRKLRDESIELYPARPRPDKEDEDDEEPAPDDPFGPMGDPFADPFGPGMEP
jgi:hypothetical protein